MANKVKEVADYCSIHDGQLILHNGSSHLALLRKDPPTLGLTVSGLDGNGRRRIQVPLAKKPPGPLPEAWEYMKITDLLVESAEVATATLKSWDDEDSKKTEKKFRITCKETIKEISAALEKEYHEVFCTIIKIMGKEVLGHVKCLPKDPPILRMPDLVMKKIFSNLGDGDLFNCRLVTDTWASKFLPITYLRTCASLEVGIRTNNMESIRVLLAPTPVLMRKRLRAIQNEPDSDNWGTEDVWDRDGGHPAYDYDRHFKFAYLNGVISRPVFPNLRELKEAGLLHNVEYLNLYIYGPPSDPEDYGIICGLRNLLTITVDEASMFRDRRYARKLQSVEEEFGDVWDLLIAREMEASSTAGVVGPQLWSLLADIIRNNKESLQCIIIEYVKELLREKDNQVDLEVLKDCSKLYEISFETGGEMTFIKNIEALPSSLSTLRLENLKNPLKKQQVQWITQNLTNLASISIDAGHSYEEAEDVDDVDQVTVCNLLTIPSLRYASLFFGDFNDRNRIVEHKLREMIRFFETTWENRNWEFESLENVLRFYSVEQDEFWE